MKKLIGITGLIVAFVTFSAMTFLASEIKFSKETHDFGNIPHNKPATFEFTFTNTGDSPLKVEGVIASCGCSAVEFSKDAINPNGTGKIKVSYDAAVKGPFTKSFTVKTNSKTPVKNLTIKGNVE